MKGFVVVVLVAIQYNFLIGFTFEDSIWDLSWWADARTEFAPSVSPRTVPKSLSSLSTASFARRLAEASG